MYFMLMTHLSLDSICTCFKCSGASATSGYYISIALDGLGPFTPSQLVRSCHACINPTRGERNTVNIATLRGKGFDKDLHFRGPAW